MNGVYIALGAAGALAAAAEISRRTGSRTVETSELTPVFPVGLLGNGVVAVQGLRLRTVATPEDSVTVYRFGDNLLVLLRDDVMPRYIASLFSEDENNEWRVDLDVWLEGDEVAKALGKNFRRRRHSAIALDMLNMMG